MITRVKEVLSLGCNDAGFKVSELSLSLFSVTFIWIDCMETANLLHSSFPQWENLQGAQR